MIVCDLCGQQRECTERVIEAKAYDICAGCWHPLEEKLKGKGRPVEKDETIVLLPGPAPEPRRTEHKPLPGQPPKIWGTA